MEPDINCTNEKPESRKMSNNNKRRRTMSYEDHSLHNPSPPSVVFICSEQDQPSVDIITKNLTQFACLADDHGFQLSVNCETGTNVVVYLKKINSSEEYSTKKMIEKLKSLVEKKKHEKTMESNMEEWKSSFEQRLKELEQKDEKNDIHKKIVTKALLKEEKGYDEDSFFYQSNFELIRNSPHTLDKMAEHLTTEDGSFWRAPFDGIISCKQKRKELLSYFDLLQTDFDDEYYDEEEEAEVVVLTRMQERICSWASFNRAFQPKGERMMAIMNEMKRKFNLVEDIVGTVHVVPARLDYNGPWYLLVFIVDKVIVLATHIMAREEKEMVNEVLDAQSSFRRMSEWRGLKLATKLPLKAEDQEIHEEGNEFNFNRGPLFVQVENEEVYKENEKVMTFIKRNFYLRGWHMNSIGAIYNLCQDCY